MRGMNGMCCVYGEGGWVLRVEVCRDGEDVLYGDCFCIRLVWSWELGNGVDVIGAAPRCAPQIARATLKLPDRVFSAVGYSCRCFGSTIGHSQRNWINAVTFQGSRCVSRG